MEERNYILFEEYLSGSISEKEQIELEERLQADSELQQAFETYKEASGYLENRFQKEAEIAAFKENLAVISERYFDKIDKAPKSRKIQTWQLGVAASIAVLLIIFGTRWFSNPSYGDYANYPEISMAVRGDNNALLTQAEIAFNNQNYTEAETLFAQLLETDSANLQFQLYRAVSLVETDQFEEADAIFEKIANTSSAYQNQAKWYAALSKLKQKEYDTSAEILKNIPEEAAVYARAQELLDAL